MSHDEKASVQWNKDLNGSTMCHIIKTVYHGISEKHKGIRRGDTEFYKAMSLTNPSFTYAS